MFSNLLRKPLPVEDIVRWDRTVCPSPPHATLYRSRALHLCIRAERMDAGSPYPPNAKVSFDTFVLLPALLASGLIAIARDVC